MIFWGVSHPPRLTFQVDRLSSEDDANVTASLWDSFVIA